MPKPRLLKALQNILGLAILCWFGWYLWNQRSLFTAIEHVSLGEVLQLSLLILLAWLATSAQSYVLFKQSGAAIRFGECYLLTLASTFGNYLPMRAGTMVRAYYMKSQYQLDYVKFGSVFSIRLVLLLIASGLVGIVATLSLPSLEDKSLPILALFGGLILGSALIYRWQPTSNQKDGTLYRLWEKFCSGIQQLKSKPSTSVICLLLILCQLLCLAWRFQLAASMLGHDVSLPIILILVSLASVGSFIAITPGGLGVRESLMGYATLATGSSFSLGIVIGSVDRILLLIMTAILGGASFVWVWWQLNRRDAKPKPV